jgi:hypothetical protein
MKSAVEFPILLASGALRVSDFGSFWSSDFHIRDAEPKLNNYFLMFKIFIILLLLFPVSALPVLLVPVFYDSNKTEKMG